MDCRPPGSSVHGDSPGKNSGVGCHFLLQGIFLRQGSNPCLLHCRWILYHCTTWETHLNEFKFIFSVVQAPVLASFLSFLSLTAISNLEAELFGSPFKIQLNWLLPSAYTAILPLVLGAYISSGLLASKSKQATLHPIIKLNPTSRMIFFFNWNPLCSFFFIIFISWRLITLQYYRGFCHTLTWISHGFTCIPHPDPLSHLPLHLIPLGLPSDL